MPRPPLNVALTGGIASGKSAVADCFAALDVAVIDADVVARELVAPAGAAIDDVVSAFGQAALDADGALDRRAMRERIFRDPDARHRLEAILHPRVRAVLRARATEANSPYVLLVIPLLVESAHYDWIERVIVVDVARETQRARLIARDGITPQLADAMLDAQATREQRLAIADYVLENEGPVDALAQKVRSLHARLLALADAKAKGQDIRRSEPSAG